MRRPVIVVALVVLAAAVAFVAVADRADHRWSWKLADLDRNRLDLALFRGADSGEELAARVEQGEVVAVSGGREPVRGGDTIVVVRYERPRTDWFGGATGDVDADCYRFTFADGETSAFDLVDCPSGRVDG